MRAAGARIKFITDGDVAGAMMAAQPGTGVDILLGIGGAPEAVVAAARSNAWAARSSAASGRATRRSASTRSRRC